MMLNIELDAVLVSVDRDVGRFDGLAWELPPPDRSRSRGKP